MAHRKLAHLNALRAFETAARHNSFAKAAEELGVTAGAVSQQIRQLEDYYGSPLFRRHNRRISLTEEAQAVLPDIRAAFDRLAAATARLQAPFSEARLLVSAPPALASKWLVHRLGAFAELSGLRVDLEAGDRLVDFHRDEADVAVRYGRGGWKGVAAERLADEFVTPAAAPGWLETAGVTRPADLLATALIHDRAMANRPDFPTWADWFAAAGVKGTPSGRALGFSSSVTAVQAAIDGQGVVLGRSLAVVDDVNAGRLVTPFSDLTLSGWSYWLVRPEGAPTPRVAAFREWLIAEFAALGA